MGTSSASKLAGVLLLSLVLTRCIWPTHCSDESKRMIDECMRACEPLPQQPPAREGCNADRSDTCESRCYRYCRDD